MRHNESRLQKQCVAWFRMQYPRLALLLFAVPNGGARNRVEAAIMNGEGVTAGVADVLLLYPSSGYHGLCVEFKTPKGRQQPTQQLWQQHVEQAGYRYEIVRSLDEFLRLVKHYFNQNDAY